jgi:hypothetical protein
VNTGDNGYQNYWNHGDTRMWNAVTWTRTNNINPTDINAANASSWTTTTDVGVYTGDFSGNTQCQWQDPATGRWWLQPWCCEQATFTTDTGTQIPFVVGAAWIESLNSAREVEQHKLYFETDNLNSRGWNGTYLNAIACHEAGHTLGLTHLGGTCMTNPPDASQIGFSSDQRTHINDHYPERSG